MTSTERVRKYRESHPGLIEALTRGDTVREAARSWGLSISTVWALRKALREEASAQSEPARERKSDPEPAVVETIKLGRRVEIIIRIIS